ncbi:MAG: hypothetical protein EA397_17715 [Deltaproteobacteria bacterium]|nr:MAG: hypothetical protein EA397_17715 [Deltaproteobacteria bacterium]
MQHLVSLRLRAGVEHADGDAFVRAPVTMGVPTSIKAGDKVWLQVVAGAGLHVYGLAVSDSQGTWRKVVHAAPDSAQSEERLLFADGWVLSEQDAQMRSLYVVASVEPLSWLDALDAPQDCSALAAQPKADVPSTPCEHLMNLRFEVPSAPRGKGRGVPAELIREPGKVAVPGMVAEQRAAGRAVVVVHFKPRA